MLGRAGPVWLDRTGYLEALEEARVLQHWRSGRPPPLEALAAPGLRRRLLIEALEARVVREEVNHRSLVIPPTAVEAALRNAAEGRPLEAARPVGEAPEDPDRLEAVLVARYGVVGERMRRVALDQLSANALIEALLDAEPEAALQQRWLDENTYISLDLLRIPRVPTGREIDEALRTHMAEVTTWHAAHPALFHRPERVRVQRVEVSGPDAQARAEALRARAVAGEALADLAREAAGALVRPGDLEQVVTRERLPAAFAVPVGGLTPVVPEGAGFAFYRVESQLPGMERPLTDESARRESAAGWLRDEDRLPQARAWATQATALLKTAPDGPELAALVKEARIQRATTRPFPKSAGEVVPEVGLAPELFAAAFALTPAAPVSAAIRVRQDYVVARLVTREAPDPGAWAAAQAAFVAHWRQAESTRILDRWLSKRLAGEALWVDQPALIALDIPGVPKVDAGKSNP